MKKIILLTFTIMTFLAVHAQYENENIQLVRNLQSIENRIISQKSDQKAIELMREEQDAKKNRDHYVMKQPGYGKAAVSAKDLYKFRQKLEKKDPDYVKVNNSYIDAIKVKREYISTIDSNYYKTYQELLSEKEE